jgi:hypothetical protein
MGQRFGAAVSHGWSPARAETLDPPRSRSQTADKVLNGVTSIAARLAIDPVEDRDLLFEQYDFKLRSHGNRLGVFCLSVAPALLAMAAVLGAFKIVSKLRFRD